MSAAHLRGHLVAYTVHYQQVDAFANDDGQSYALACVFSYVEDI